jgi:phosphate starvation-inducible protein PhoH
MKICARSTLEVGIARRGEHFSVQGAQAGLARQVLQDFYLEARHDITLERLQLGLIEARSVLKDVRGIMFCDFLAEDVVRHPLVQKIVTAYEHYEQQKNA